MRNVDAMGEAADLGRVAAFARSHPDACRHVVDLPYRLAAPSAQDAANRRLWASADGGLVAFAIAQLPFWSLDYAVALDAGEELERAVVAWGVARWRELARLHGRPAFYVDCAEGQPERVALLEGLGFARSSDWRQYHLRQPLDAPIAVPALPEGFVIRPLAGALAEAGAYAALHRAAFGSEDMTEAWRRQTLLMPEYRPDLDLVAVAPDGRLAGFCVCWLAEVAGGSEGQVEPIGVHPDFQGHGLGRALLIEGLRRLRAAGARVAHVEVDGGNDAARALYESAGFHVSRTILKYGLEL